MKKIIIIIMILTTASLAYLFYNKKEVKTSDRFLNEEVVLGTLENIISCTGQLEAVKTVEVGTQISGTIDKVYADFNSKVKKGDIIAVLDTTLLSIALHETEAALEKSEAIFKKTEADYNKNKSLFEKEVIPEIDIIYSKTEYLKAKSDIKANKLRLKKAEKNLQDATIKSPIDGIVIQKNIENGQTVSSSLSAPVLFVIAEDLRKMEIIAKVDESDIGQISEGQEVKFDVLTFPDRLFNGVVKQIRLYPETIQNVVNYSVIISVDNEDESLLPGMTATIECIVEKKDNILKISNKALEFRPRLNRNGNKRPANASAKQKKRKLPSSSKRVWCMDENSKLQPLVVKTGMSDGQMTEIYGNSKIKEGLKVITSMVTSQAKKPSANKKFKRLF